MFPLGSVLLPGAVLQLQVFEPRYSALMNTVMATTQEFGVTLIERGAEVGGGDQRLPVGCVAKVLLAQPLGEGRWILQAIGTDRFSVDEWLPEDPYPVATVCRFGPTSAEDAELFEVARTSPISTLDAYSILAAENSQLRRKLLHSALAHVEELRQAQRQWG